MNQIAVRDGKGKKDRVTMLSEIVKHHLQQHLEKDVRTTMIYTHVLNKGGQGVISPSDQLQAN